MLSSIRRAFSEFLLLPTLIIVGFLGLAALMYSLDQTNSGWVADLRSFMRAHLFTDSQSTRTFLTTVAGSVITVTSITFSLLLIAVQQSAASLTSQVFDQFLRRPINQIYLGFFIGLALYALVILASVNSPFNPVLGASVCFVLIVAALYLLALLVYNTIDQMRPSRIIEAIHDHVLQARRRECALLARTRRAPAYPGPATCTATAEHWGFVTAIDLDRLEASVKGCAGQIEIRLAVSLGSFVSRGDTLATVWTEDRREADRITAATSGALRIERRRDLRFDAAFGIAQLVTIGWTAGSNAKQNLAPATLTVELLRDILNQWARDDPAGDSRLPIVYEDTTTTQLLRAFEALAVVSGESRQYQLAAHVAHAVATVLERADTDLQDRLVAITRRALPCFKSQPLTEEMESALEELSTVLFARGYEQPARDVRAALLEMGV